MFRDRTLFIIGAGASAEVGMPLGVQLARNVSDALTFKFDDFGRLKAGDYDLYQCLRSEDAEEFDKRRRAARQIASGIRLARSIDNYIDTHRDPAISFCSKLGIARCILSAERNSKLFYDTSNLYNKYDFNRLEDTWLLGFSEILFDGIQKSYVDDVFNNISIICFNYDRCIEYFLFLALRSHYALDESTSLEILSRLRIFHPYGVVGSLSGRGTPSIPPGRDTPSIPFGCSADTQTLAALSEEIRTYTEQIQDQDFLDRLRTEVATAETLVFLGFGFLRQNMQLLKPTEFKRKRIFATAFGISDFDIDELRTEVASLCVHPDQISSWLPYQTMEIRNDKTCAELFREYQLSLSQR